MTRDKNQREHFFKGVLASIVIASPCCLASNYLNEKPAVTAKVPSNDTVVEQSLDNLPVASISFVEVENLKASPLSLSKNVSETTSEVESTSVQETTQEETTTEEETTTQEPETTTVFVEEETEAIDYQQYSEYELYSLAKVIYSEAGDVYESSRRRQEATDAGIDSDIWQQYVGYVFLNRLASSKFPNTIEGVLAGGYDRYTIQRFYDGIYSEDSLRNAAICLENYYAGTIPVPSNLVYQAEFPQGSTYLIVGNTYFGLKVD